MKACLIIDDMNLSDHNYGGTNHIHDLAVSLQKKGIETTIFSFSNNEEKIKAAFTNALSNTTASFPIRFFKNSRSILKHVAYFKECDIIHSVSWSSIPALRVVSLKTKVPFLFHSLNSLKTPNAGSNHYKKIMLSLFSPDHVAFCDRNSQRSYQSEINKVSSSYLPNPVDTELFYPVQKRFSNTFLFASSLTKAKGFHDVISAFERVHAKYKTVQLLVAGKGSLLSLAKETEGVTYLGSISHANMPTVFNKADVLLNPSYFEGFSLTVLEALSAGLPVITTAVGGHRILEEEHSAMIIDSGDIDSLEAAMFDIIINKELRLKLKRNGRNFVMKNHSWSLILQRVSQLYEQIC
ncbi:hypothetical protein COT72_03990 [archaeon CG10_big_fil_rev_8_21_14_0_10_43_11]|nr:MAG: hypothetical protein COT72_03990 [archaeon CG10_big_fil_rev_8_21_14_0_10_43_11]